MAFKEVTNSSSNVTYWPKKAAERKVGDAVVGEYIGKKEARRPDGTTSILYMLKNGEETIGVNSSATIATAMSQIPEGSTVKIVYEGKQRSSKTGREYNNFKVFLDDGGEDDSKDVDLSSLDF